MGTKSIRFGVMAGGRSADYAALRNFCLRAEELGYDSVWSGDHLRGDLPHPGREGGIPPADAPLLESWTALTALAVETTRIRLGTLTLCNSFRHPPLLAKMIASLDVISNGRLEVGVGYGYLEAEHRTYGYDFPPIGERSRRMAEAIEIWKLMWTQHSPSFEGRYYHISEVICEPKPVQKPFPPLWVGGVGEKLTFPLVARYADRWNGVMLSPDEVKEKIAVLDECCRAIGRDPATLEKTAYARVIIGYEPEIGETLRRKAASKAPDSVRRASVRGGTVEQFAAKMIAGTPEQCIDKVEQYVAAGISYFILDWEGLQDIESLELFASKVMPHFR